MCLVVQALEDGNTMLEYQNRVFSKNKSQTLYILFVFGSVVQSMIVQGHSNIWWSSNRYPFERRSFRFKPQIAQYLFILFLIEIEITINKFNFNPEGFETFYPLLTISPCHLPHFLIVFLSLSQLSQN